MHPSRSHPPLVRIVLVALTLANAAHARPQETSSAAAPGREVDRTVLRALHDRYASFPHPAGSPGDALICERLVEDFTAMGLEVEKQELWLHLPRPVRARVAVTAPETVELPLREDVIEDDPFSAHADLDPGWSAYSASGRVEADVVYVNRGTKEDFERLAELGVDVRGKIAIARFGGNYRGYKAHWAAQAGAAGLLMYTDPRDAGWGRGLSWPEGGWAHPSHVQRGSILTLPWNGDPLTPGVPAAQDAERLAAGDVAFPTIPVQPLGWNAAREILGRMRGAEAPDAWQGGLPFRYRLTGGPTLRVLLEVEHETALTRTWNVVATLKGSEQPELYAVLGCHHDAWTFGASDPCAGLIALVEAARVLAAAPEPPRRSLKFAAWAAEEHGIMGSVEWVESRLEEVRADCIAYVNLDMAAMGMEPGAAATPSLARAVIDAAAAVSFEGETLLERWRGAAGTDPQLGHLGGGSDHVGFLALASVPCVALGAGGAEGTSYHGAYDDLAWYRRIVGDDYASADLVTRWTVALARELADAPLVPLRPTDTGGDVAHHVGDLVQRAARRFPADDGNNEDGESPAERARRILTAFEPVARSLAMPPALTGEHRAVTAANLDAAGRARLNRALIDAERVWFDAEGLPGRPFFGNLFAAPDEDSGYAAWLLPGLRRAVERGSLAELQFEAERLAGAFARLGRAMRAVAAITATAEEN